MIKEGKQKFALLGGVEWILVSVWVSEGKICCVLGGFESECV